MTTREARGLAPEAIDEESIARYLQLNLDFFERHQAILARLRLPHARSASTISLVERQVEVLRERQAELEGKLAEFVKVARANDALSAKIQRFTRRLLRADSRRRMAEEIEASLREDFDAFHSTLILTNGHGAGFEDLPERFLRAVAPDDANLKSFEGLFASGKPRCGQVRDTQRQFLFGADAGEIGSVALVPLGEHGAIGLLALGSHDRERFHPGMSTEFLARMGELIADAVIDR
ncbi:MAG: hypothetical protein CMLOHMNK_03381 [Steroidobacteraceae bacterium]|nr:hypothetical protein [Steroidobacteraceae bacterium]